MSMFALIRRVVPLQFSAAPWRNVFMMIAAMLHGLTWTAGIVATQGLFDAVSRAAAGQAVFMDAFVPLLWLAAATFAQQTMNGVHNFMHMVMNEITVGSLSIRLFAKLKNIDPARFEDTDFLDDLNKGREGIKEIYNFCVGIVTLPFFYGVFFLSVGIYLFRLQPMLAAILGLSFVPALLSQIVRARVFTKLEEEAAPVRREHEYYQKTLCDREYFKETRILGAFRFFKRLFDETLRTLVRKEWNAERKMTLLQLGLNITSFGGMAVATVMLFNATMDGIITVGAFAAVFGALGMIFDIMDEIVNMHIGGMNKNVGKVSNYIRLLDAPERQPVAHTDRLGGVMAEDISFTYPGRSEPAINGVSLHISENETVAIVGENGAGKSTLVRLLTGIYQPSEGSVKLGADGVSGVFQKFQRYKMTLRENISISDRRADADDKEVARALREAGTDFDFGMETMLSPEFDGIDLSGGQWQRLAIARGLYRAGGFMVLDEPTAAIDPIEETRVYQQFQHLAKGKCALIVTHRLGSAKLADRIIVMEAGRITDTGTHEELLARTGKYAEMWAAQAQWYERD